MRRCLSCFTQIDEYMGICPYCGYVEGYSAQNKIFLAPGTKLSDRYTVGKVLYSDRNNAYYIAWDYAFKTKVKIREYLPVNEVKRDTDTKALVPFDENGSAVFDKGYLQFVDEAKKLFQDGGNVRLFDCISENNTAYMILEYTEEDKAAEKAAMSTEAQSQSPADKSKPAAQTQAAPSSPFAPPRNNAFAPPANSPFAPPGTVKTQTAAPKAEPSQAQKLEDMRKAAAASDKSKNTGLMDKIALLPMWLKILVPAVIVVTVLSIIIAGIASANKKKAKPTETTEATETSETAPVVNLLRTKSFSFKGHTYAYYDEAKTWEEAKEFCESMGGHLVVITSKEENDALWAFANTVGNNSAFIGLSDSKNEGTWEWVTGEALTYTKWAEGQPDGYTPEENYAELAFNQGYGFWNDYAFDTHDGVEKTGFICEWEYDVSNPVAEEALTTDEALTAFQYHIAGILISEDNAGNTVTNEAAVSSEDSGDGESAEPIIPNWNLLRNNENTSTFYYETESGEYYIFYTDLPTGVTTSLKYADYSCDVVLSIGEYDYNAFTYLVDIKEKFKDTTSTDLQGYLHKDINEAAKEIGGLENAEGDDATDLQNSDMFISTTSGTNSDDIRYIQVRGYSGTYSLYGVTPGMKWDEAVTRMAFAGAVTATRVDDRSFVMTMEDGTTITLTNNESKTLTHIAARCE